jgi:hypothetical protein
MTALDISSSANGHRCSKKRNNQCAVTNTPGVIKNQENSIYREK